MPIVFSQMDPVNPGISAAYGAAQADQNFFPTLANVYATVTQRRQQDLERQQQMQQFLMARQPSARDAYEAAQQERQALVGGQIQSQLQNQRLQEQAREFQLGRQVSPRDVFSQQAEAQQQILRGQIQGQLQAPDLALRYNAQQMQGQQFLLGQQQQQQEFLLGREPSNRDAFEAQQRQQLQDQHLQGQMRLQSEQLSQAEQIRMQRLQAQLAAIDGNPNLGEEDRQDLRMQVQTNLHPYEMRMARSQLMQQQQHQQQVQQQMDFQAYLQNRQMQFDSDGFGDNRFRSWTDEDGNTHTFFQHRPGEFTHLPGMGPARQEVRPQDVTAMTRDLDRSMEREANPPVASRGPDWRAPAWATGGSAGESWRAERDRRIADGLATLGRPVDRPFSLQHPERASGPQRQALQTLFDAQQLAMQSQPEGPARQMVGQGFQQVMEALARRGSVSRMSPQERGTYNALMRQVNLSRPVDFTPGFRAMGNAWGLSPQ